MLQLSPPTIYVGSFSQLSKLVHLADDKKLEEVRECLEGKHDDHRMRFESNLHPKQSSHQHTSITHRLNLFVLLVILYNHSIMLPLVILYRYVFTLGPLPKRDKVMCICLTEKYMMNMVRSHFHCWWIFYRVGMLALFAKRSVWKKYST